MRAKRNPTQIVAEFRLYSMFHKMDNEALLKTYEQLTNLMSPGDLRAATQVKYMLDEMERRLRI